MSNLDNKQTSLRDQVASIISMHDHDLHEKAFSFGIDFWDWDHDAINIDHLIDAICENRTKAFLLECGFSDHLANMFADIDAQAVLESAEPDSLIAEDISSLVNAMYIPTKYWPAFSWGQLVENHVTLSELADYLTDLSWNHDIDLDAYAYLCENNGDSVIATIAKAYRGNEQAEKKVLAMIS